jgi:alkaline phosphatase D
MKRVLPLLLVLAGCLNALSGAAPAGESPVIERVAFGSCAAEDEPQPVWQAVLGAEPDLWIWAGDNIYGDTEDMEELRAKYALLRAQSGYAALLDSGIPILATWDDHDYGANDAGSEYPMREQSQEAFLDFFGVAEDSPRRDREGVYHAEIFGPPGKRLQVILLDTRYHRSGLEKYTPDPETGRAAYRSNTDREATILGEEQWEWLGEQLRKPAELRLIVSSIQVVSGEHIWEKWLNFPGEYRRLQELIHETGAEGVVFLSGDRHHAELSRLPEGEVGYPLYDLTSSGINKSRPRESIRRPEPNRHRLGRTYNGNHFGLVEIAWEEPDPVVRLSILNGAGERPIHHAFTLSELRESGLFDGFGKDYTDPGDPETPLTGKRFQLDGKVTDWASDDLAMATGSHLYLRFPVPGERTLRRNPTTLHLRLDLDASAGTGARLPWEPGTDLELLFAAPLEPGDHWRRSVRAVDHTGGDPREIDLDAISLAAAPTHASTWFELRIDRAGLRTVLPGFASARNLEASVVTINHDSGRQRLLVRESISLPVLEPAPAEVVELPRKPESGIRVMALNTLWGSQLEDPAPFGRIMRALDTDLYLIQEWSRERISEAEVIAWFREHVDPEVAWQTVVAGVAGSWSGTLIVSRWPVTAGSGRYTPVDAGGWDFPARFAAAVIEAPAGRILAASVHLKASGAIDTPEDTRRLAEADAVNRLLLGMKSVARPDLVVLGGDFNLLGSTAVMERATRMLDLDGSSLQVVEAPVLGDRELLYTHGTRGMRGRLDYLTYSESTATLRNAFVLDTAILDAVTLEAYGLEAADSEATDHLPVVMDLSLPD